MGKHAVPSTFYAAPINFYGENAAGRAGANLKATRSREEEARR